jgi:PAS domain S-box-containing protein
MSSPTKILMLEDNRFDAELNQRALSDAGIELNIEVVTSGKAYEEVLQEFKPDLILSDFSLPGYDGFCALRAALEFDSDLPFILVTGAIGEEHAVEMLKQGASDYILKDRLARLPEAVIRALKDAERTRQLKESEGRYRLLMESSHYGLWDWDLLTNDLYLSPQWKQMLGYADDELTNCFDTFQSLLHKDDRKMVMETVQRFLENPDKWDVEFRMLHKRGEVCWINARASFETDVNNKVTRMLGVHIDVTQRHKNEERLRQAAQVFSSTVEGVTITDTRGTILDVNPAFSEITGFSREQVIGENQSILKSGRHSNDFYRSMWQSLHSEGFWKGEIWNRRKSGQVYPAQLTISAVKDEQRKTTGYVGVFSDITQSKKTEARLDFLAHHDPLTGLPNRLLFNARLSQALRHARRHSSKLAVLFIDLDHFKNINDSLGHAFGD